MIETKKAIEYMETLKKIAQFKLSNNLCKSNADIKTTCLDLDVAEKCLYALKNLSEE